MRQNQTAHLLGVYASMTRRTVTIDIRSSLERADPPHPSRGSNRAKVQRKARRMVCTPWSSRPSPGSPLPTCLLPHPPSGLCPAPSEEPRCPSGCARAVSPPQLGRQPTDAGTGFALPRGRGVHAASGCRVSRPCQANRTRRASGGVSPPAKPGPSPARRGHKEPPERDGRR